MDSNKKGIFFVFLSAILYSLGGLFIKLIPWNGIAVNGMRAVFALVVVGGYLLYTRHRIFLNRWVLLGAIAVCGTNLLFCMANKLTTAANAIVLQFTAPVFVILITLFLLKKKPSRMEVVTCVAVFAGILCFFVDSLSTGGHAGNIVAILSGLCYAVVFFLNKFLGDDSILAIFWGYILCIVIGAPYVMAEQTMNLTILGCLVILGIFQSGLGFLFLILGLRTTPPVTASLLAGIEPVLNPILVAIFYHETIGALALVGAVIVVSSIMLYNIILGRQTVHSS